MELIADRFVAVGDDRAIDLATGEPVLIVSSTSGGPSDERRWALRCEWWFDTRHRSIAELVDYGPIGETRRFEAWQTTGPWRGSARAAEAAERGAAMFLGACGRTRPAQPAKVGSSLDGRPIVVPGGECGHEEGSAACVEHPPLEMSGVSLVPRRAVPAIAELFADGARRPRVLALCGAPGAGVSTVVRELARAARMNGFVPLSLEHLRETIQPALAGRSLFVVANVNRIQDSWSDFLALALGSPKPHVLLFAGHDAVPRVESVHLEYLTTEQLTQAMKPVPDAAKDIKRVWAAARRARGSPGRFVEWLWRLPSKRSVVVARRPSIAAEHGVGYGDAEYHGPEISPRRTGQGWADPAELAVLRRKLDAAVAQLAAGRHAPGERGLRAALAGLVRRHDWARATHGAIALGSALMRRGRVRETHQTLSEAGEYSRRAGDDSAVADIAILSGVAWTELGRLDEAEGLLGASFAAATSNGDHVRTASSRLALARCLFWGARFDESIDMLEPLEAADTSAAISVRRLVGLSRAHVGRRDLEAALGYAVEASETAQRSGDASLLAQATCGLAFAHLAVGDRAAVERDVSASIRAARRARDPLRALRARLIGAENDRRAGRTAAAAALVARLSRIPAGQLPATIRARGVLLKDLLTDASVTDTVRRHVAASGLRALALYAPPPPDEARDLRLVVDDVVEILQGSQTGDDDKAVLTRVCEMLRVKLRAATIAFFARDRGSMVPLVWDGSNRLEPEMANRVSTVGQAVAPHAHHNLVEGGAPVRYGGETIGACIARWTLGASPDATRSSLLLTTAATAVGPAMAGAIARRTERQVHDPVELVGSSHSMAEVRRAIERAASAPFPVLIEGESGSGKELVARALHRRSSRRDRPFCALNCAALPDDLVEAELFGHARGAFTGAVTERPGVFEEAHTGTLFLDEIGELSARAQAKVLRTVQEGELRRVGDNVSRRVDVRIVSATNRDLRQEAAVGRFRLDLLYRLDVVRIALPPLRDRREDVALLVERYWQAAAERVGSRAILGAATLAALARYDWPGNVRELQNVLAALAVRCSRRGVVTPDALPPAFGAPPPASVFRLDAARRTFEERFVRAALVRSGGHRGRAALELGVTRQGLTKLMARLGISESPAET